MLPAHAHFHTCESIGKNSRAWCVYFLYRQDRQSHLCLSLFYASVMDRELSVITSAISAERVIKGFNRKWEIFSEFEIQCKVLFIKLKFN